VYVPVFRCHPLLLQLSVTKVVLDVTRCHHFSKVMTEWLSYPMLTTECVPRQHTMRNAPGTDKNSILFRSPTYSPSS
jgi:hypothetical protein